MKIKTLKSTSYFILLLGLTLVIFNPACSKDEEDVEEEIEGEEDGEAEEGEADAQGEEAAPQGGESASQELANAEGGEEDEEEEEVVEDAAEEAETSEAEPETVEPTTEPSTTAEASPETPTEPTADEVPAAEAPAVPSAEPQVAPAPTESLADMSGANVKYIRHANAKLLNQPGGNAVKNLQKGDHVVVIALQNGFAQLDNGLFISEKSISAKPIGRARGSNPWKSKK